MLHSHRFIDLRGIGRVCKVVHFHHIIFHNFRGHVVCIEKVSFGALPSQSTDPTCTNFEDSSIDIRRFVAQEANDRNDIIWFESINLSVNSENRLRVQEEAQWRSFVIQQRAQWYCNVRCFLHLQLQECC